MDAVEEYAFICIACQVPLLRSIANQWVRVGKRHLMPRTGSSLRELDQLLLEDDSVFGKQELAQCELQRLQCGSCKSQIGLRCKSAPKSKKRLIGRLFVRQDALEVHGLTAPWSSNTSQHLQFNVENQPYLVSSTASSASPVAESTSRLSDPPAPKQVIPNEQIQALLSDHARLIAEVKALRKDAAASQRLLRARLDQGSDAKSPANESHAAESMIIDSHDTAVNRTESASVVETRSDTQLALPPIDPGPRRGSDSDYEPSQPLRDQPLHQTVTRKLASGEKYRAKRGGGSFSLRRNTLEDLHKAQETMKQASDPNRRGGALRRGISGGRGRAIPSEPQRAQLDTDATPLRDEYGHLLTSTGKIDGRSLRYKKKRTAEYQSSPLASPRTKQGAASSDSNMQAHSDDAVSGEPATDTIALAKTASSTSSEGASNSHQEIMKYVNKGMRAQMAKSRLERGYARLPKPS